MLHKLSITASLGTILGLAGLSAAVGQDFASGLAPQPGVVMLRNGEIIEGKILRSGEYYRVALPEGEIRLKGCDVEFCCRDLEEGYRRKRSTMRVGNASEHLQLAEWCLRHGLLGKAACELADTMDADPHHPMIRVLESRLKMALEPPAPASTARPQQETADDLQRVIQGMPPGTVELFTQSIQPVLLNHCATTACHGPRATSRFRLQRIPPGQPSSRRITQRNLQAVLPWIDRENPTASRLLEAASHAHGTAKAPVFADPQAIQYQRLIHWVGQVARHSPPADGALAGGRANDPFGPAPPPTLPGQQPHASKEPGQGPDPGATPTGADVRPPRVAGDERPPTLPPSVLTQQQRQARPLPGTQPRLPPNETPPEPSGAAAASYQEPFPPSDGTQGPKRGNPLPAQFVPVDPFDPEVFNRRYFGDPTNAQRPAAETRPSP